MDLYNIHGDTGGDWRMNKFKEYCDGDIDDTLAPMNWLLKKAGANRGDRIWASFLYSTCYCLGTTMFMYNELFYGTLTPRKLDEFWEDYKKDLVFQTDRKYAKNLNWFVPMVVQFMAKTKRDPEKYFRPLLTGTPEEVYRKMYKEVSGWKFFGRFSTILFLKTLISILPIEMDFDTEYDWANGETTTAGALILHYRDEEAKQFLLDHKITPDMKKYFDELLEECKGKIAGNMLHTSSAFCSHFKLYKEQRYLGYYVDRGQHELRTLQKNLPQAHELWDRIWIARRRTIDWKYLGEINGWAGTRPEKCHDFMKTGRMYE